MTTDCAVTPPTDDEKAAEARLYFVVRSDLALTRASLVEIAATATWRTLKRALQIAPPRVAAYDPALQPKIALRVKTLAHLQRAFNEATAAGLPATLVDAAPGLPAMVGIGPLARTELPDFVRKLQMLSDTTNEAGTPVPPREEPILGPKLWIVVRDNAGIPFGKLVPQAGHGCWATIHHALTAAPERIAAWDAAGTVIAPRSVADLANLQGAYQAARDVGLPASYIIDAGRTVFGEPTPTVVGIGPCDAIELPTSLLSLGPIR
jgi:peptidyl-tRNA hydrolase